MTGSLDHFSGMVGHIYATVHDETAWQPALAALADLTGSQSAVMHRFASDGAVATTGINLDHDSMDEFGRDYAAVCPRLRFLMQHPDVPVQYDRMVISDAERRRDPTYAFFERQGVGFYAGSAIVTKGQVVAAFSVQRNPREGHVEAPQIQVVGLARTHASHALALAARFGRSGAVDTWQAASRTLQPNAIFVLDALGRVIGENEAAHDLLLEHDAVGAIDGSLSLAIGAEQPALDRVIARALSIDLGAPPGWVWISRPSGRGRLAATAMAVPAIQHAHYPPGACALLLIVDPSRRIAPDHAALRDLFGLTPAEIRVATLLVAGYDRPAAARHLGVSEQTLRSQTKAIFAKMRIHRQADLVRLAPLFSFAGQ